MTPKKVAFLFPGQGAQYKGMGLDIYTQFASARQVFDRADELLGFSLSQLIFEGPEQDLLQTKNSQVAIFVTSMALLAVLRERHPDLLPLICAGLSLGEYTALCAAGKISFEDCLMLVRARGLFMQEASEKYPGGLSVVLGLDLEQVEAAIAPFINSVWIANVNCPKQVVISGTHAALEKAAVALKEAGAKRVLPLEVSGAFHSGLMKEAQDKLMQKIHQVTLIDTPVQVVMNVKGEFVQSLSEMRKNLISQVASPTFWEKSIRLIDQVPLDFYLEIGPGKTLVGMNKKIGTVAASYNLEKREDFDKLETLLLTGIA